MSFGDHAIIEDEISLRDILDRIWRGRGLVAAFALVGVLAGLVLALTERVRTSAPMEYYIALPGIDKARYPNGTVFSPQDLLSRSVIDTLVETTGFGGSATALRSAFTATFANPVAAGIVQNYQSRLAQGGFSAAEIEAINTAFEDELTQATQSMVRIALDFRSLDLTESQARDIITKLPEVWSSVYTTRFRVLDNTALEGQAVASGVGLSTPAEVIEAEDSILAIKDGLGVLAADNRLALLQTETGGTPRDLLQRLRRFYDVQFSVVVSHQLGSEDRLADFYSRDLRLRISEIDEELSALDDTIADIKTILSSGTSTQETRQLAASEAAGLQISGSALQDIVSLANRASLSDYLTGLFDARQALVARRASLQTRMTMIAENPAVTTGYVQEAEQRLSDIAAQYNELLLGAREINRRAIGQLYQPASAPVDLDDGMSPMLLLLPLLGLAFGLLSGTVLAFLMPRSVVVPGQRAKTFTRRAAA